MRYIKAMIPVWIAMGVFFAMNITSLAADAKAASALPNYNKKGSVTVNVLSTDTDEAIPGGILTLYKVADLKQSGDNSSYELTDSFKKSNASTADITESDAGAGELASELESYVNRNKIKGQTAAADEDGQAVWKDLSLGVYLVVNTAASKGYEAMNAFLITVPRYLNGAYVYDVSANPKSETLDPVKADGSKPKASSPGTAASGSVGKKSSAGGKLPQTGQLWWPVPVLALAGMLFVSFGWYRRRGFGECSHEF